MKSRNTIHRILQDKSSINIIEDFLKQIIENKELNLFDFEKNELYEGYEVTKLGKDNIKGRKILFKIFRNDNSQKKEGTPHKISKDLKELFKSYLSYSQVHILIINSIYEELSEELLLLIQGRDELISIKNFINIDSNTTKVAKIVCYIYKLINYENYHIYYNDLNINEGLNLLGNMVVVFKCDQQGHETTDLIIIDENMNIEILYNNEGRNLYDFYYKAIMKQQKNYNKIRVRDDENKSIDRTIALCEELLLLEEENSEYLIKQNMCYQMINVKILCEMLKESNYLGLSESHPKIKKLINVATNRFENYFASEKRKVAIFTKRGLSDFVKNCVLTDHFYCFREFTNKEVMDSLEFLLRQMKENINFELYILKEECYIGSIEFNYYENKTLVFFDSCTSYSSDFQKMSITSKNILRLFDDFIKNELIPKHTYSKGETISFIEELIIKCSNK